VLKQLLLLLSVVYTVILVVVTLIDLSGVPKLGSSFDDKIYHLLAYLILGGLWTTTVRLGAQKKSGWFVLIWLLVFGIALELFQNQINPNRTYDLVDLAANCVGVILGTLIARIVHIEKLNIFKALLI
jgi:VanZ family protein